MCLGLMAALSQSLYPLFHSEEMTFQEIQLHILLHSLCEE